MVKVYTIGVGGPSCSGKTTVTRILKQILENTACVYQDDYYKPEVQIPIDEATQLANWDCPEAVDFKHFADNIEYARTHEGKLPEGFNSNEVSNVHDGSKLLSNEAADKLRQILDPFVQDPEAIFVIVDGFMLYWDERVSKQLDCKITFTASFETLKKRREERQGYHTLEGYWVDPPNYFEKIVWPEYVRLNQHNATVKDVLTIDTDENSIDETAIKVASKLREMLL